jgi:AcrR family transcriptional regulator
MTSAASVKRRPSERSTRDKILDAAEIEFSTRGYEGCSLRMISEANEINLGLIYYYFDGKESLFSEAYLRRSKALVDRRRALLRAAKGQYGDGPIPVEEIVRCFLAPLVEMTKQGQGPHAWIRLQGLLRGDPSAFSRKLRGKALNASNKMFLRELQRSCPQLPRASVVWRFSAMVGGFYSLISRSARVEDLSDGTCDSNDADTALAEVLPFFVRAFEAPPPATADRSSAASPVSRPSRSVSPDRGRS